MRQTNNTGNFNNGPERMDIKTVNARSLNG